MIYEPAEDSFLLEKHIKYFAKGKVLDIGSGSGILAFSAARYADYVLAADIDEEAVEHIRREASARGMKNIKAIKSDLFDKIKGKFDLILFNPPYLPEDKREPSASRIHTTGGKHGYEIIFRFINELEKHLEDDGKCLMVFSSLTKKDKIDEIILENCLTFKLLETESYFFEKLYLYLIEKSDLLKKLKKRKISDVKYYAKGKRGIVYIGFFKGKRVAIKKLRDDTSAREAINREAENLKLLNKHGIGPKLLLKEDNFIVTEFVDGISFKEYVARKQRNDIIRVITNLLSQCFLLDELHISKEELTRPTKDLRISNNKAVLLDFERAHKTSKPKNVTQFCQFLCTGAVRKELTRKGININVNRIRGLMKKYRQNENERKKIIRVLIKSL